ncbi:hypothetical protein PAPHI01_0787 [Pancytospora philotis]|nr:hypothetical protein PAPHI01_0787 [Pancytospora philotis]
MLSSVLTAMVLLIVQLARATFSVAPLAPLDLDANHDIEMLLPESGTALVSQLNADGTQWMSPAPVHGLQSEGYSLSLGLLDGLSQFGLTEGILPSSSADSGSMLFWSAGGGDINGWNASAYAHDGHRIPHDAETQTWPRPYEKSDTRPTAKASNSSGTNGALALPLGFAMTLTCFTALCI